MNAVRSSGRKSLSDPLFARPMGVRATETMTASGMGSPDLVWDSALVTLDGRGAARARGSSRWPTGDRAVRAPGARTGDYSAASDPISNATDPDTKGPRVEAGFSSAAARVPSN